MKPDEFKRFLERNESASFRRQNPDLFPVAPVPRTEPQPDAGREPSRAVALQEPRQRRVVCRVRIVAFRKRLCDEDNNVAAQKTLRDCIAQTLMVDDADRRVQWEYLQVKTAGEPGTLVLITENA